MHGIRFRARHGVSRAERGLAQDFTVDVDMDLPPGDLPRRDDMKDVFDYDRIGSIVVELGTSESYRLLEILAQRIASRLLAETPALATTVAVRKFAPPTTASVEQVTVEVRLVK
ncbi:MAG: dihydroneopterin aldolase [Polyangiaceae bacterium]|nr:dihydroneopterin aldolase [Polyangiaceae bacterium]